MKKEAHKSIKNVDDSTIHQHLFNSLNSNTCESSLSEEQLKQNRMMGWLLAKGMVGDISFHCKKSCNKCMQCTMEIDPNNLTKVNGPYE